MHRRFTTLSLCALLACVACDGSVTGSREHDAQLNDANTIDASTIDANMRDANTIDSGLVDTGFADTGVNDTGFADTGFPDAGTLDSGAVDRGSHVFDRDVMHEILITVDPDDLPMLDQHSDTRVPATFVFDGVTLHNVGVRNKGQSSFQPTSQKPGFSVKLDEFVQGQDLDGMKKLALNNTVQDPTWCNEFLTYDTYLRAGIPAPRVAHAVVSLNGVPKGIYTIIEPINAQFFARHYGPDMDQGNLYEGPWDFTKGANVADLKDEVEEMRSRDDLRALTDIVLSNIDATYPERLATVLDVDQFILGYAIDVVTVAWDGYAYDAWNFYLYDHPVDQRFVFLPSGANWPYFRDAFEASITIDPMELPQLWGGSDPVGFLANERVRQIPVLHARFVELLNRVTRDDFDVPALHAEFDRLRTVMHSTTRTDAATLSDLQTFDDHVDMAYDFVSRRKAYLLTQLGQ